MVQNGGIFSLVLQMAAGRMVVRISLRGTLICCICCGDATPVSLQNEGWCRGRGQQEQQSLLLVLKAEGLLSVKPRIDTKSPLYLSATWDSFQPDNTFKLHNCSYHAKCLRRLTPECKCSSRTSFYDAFIYALKSNGQLWGHLIDCQPI